MPDLKQCPLTHALCSREQCAFFSEETQTCALTALARWLKELAKKKG